MVKKVVYNRVYTIGRPYSIIRKKKDCFGNDYYAGSYTCEHGIVDVTSEPTRDRSYFNFFYNGLNYYRTIKRAYSERGLAIMAGKFVKDIISKENT